MSFLRTKVFSGHIEDNCCHAVYFPRLLLLVWPLELCQGPDLIGSILSLELSFAGGHFTFSLAGWVPGVLFRESLLWLWGGTAAERSPVLWGASCLLRLTKCLHCPLHAFLPSSKFGPGFMYLKSLCVLANLPAMALDF